MKSFWKLSFSYSFLDDIIFQNVDNNTKNIFQNVDTSTYLHSKMLIYYIGWSELR